MFKRSAVKLFAVTMLIFMAYSDGFGDIRIRFARNRTSATMRGSVRAGGVVCYVANARRGQTMTATLSSSSGRARIQESGDTSYTNNIERSGDHSICVDNNGRATAYTLTVSIL